MTNGLVNPCYGKQRSMKDYEELEKLPEDFGGEFTCVSVWRDDTHTKKRLAIELIKQQPFF